MQGIYRIRNKINDKRYIGSTNDFEKGWKSRHRVLRRGIYHNIHLQRAWNKYGEENFVFEIEEVVAGDNEALLAREQGYLDEGFALGILYNIAKDASAPMRGQCHTEKTKQEMSEAMSGENNPFYGKHHTEEVKTEISEKGKEWHRTHEHPRGMLGKHHTEEVKADRSRATSGENNPMYGRYHSEETKQGQSETRKEYYRTHEHPWTGRHHTEEEKRKIGEGNKGKEVTQETRDKLRQAMSGENNPFYGKHHTEEAKRKTGNANARDYPSFINETTKELIPAGRNLRKMCREYGLVCDNMRNLKNGPSKQTRDGWCLATQAEIEQYDL